MIRYAAFLRAVNVGGRTVRMADLSIRLAALGLRDVKTYIASGNVSFASPLPEAAVTQRIEAALLGWLGYPVATMVRPWSELEALAAANPFKGIARPVDAKLYVAFLWEPPKFHPRLPRISEKSGLTLFRVDGREAFLVAQRLPDGQFGVPNMPLEKELGVPTTTRNWNTILRMLSQGSPE